MIGLVLVHSQMVELVSISFFFFFFFFWFCIGGLLFTGWAWRYGFQVPSFSLFIISQLSYIPSYHVFSSFSISSAVYFPMFFFFYLYLFPLLKIVRYCPLHTPNNGC
ncbi:hypothetical protein HOY82DRAFT_160051 [Tuber indicum]|nr:hypothetical protein HOY82DRAFT_160051 [Tuber indicum]